MPRRKPETIREETIDEWYTAGEAAKVLTANSGKQVKPDYLFKLKQMKKVTTKALTPRVTLYSKKDIDKYKVEGRGPKKSEAA